MDSLTNVRWKLLLPVVWAIVSDYICSDGLLAKIILFPIFMPLSSASIAGNLFYKATAGYIDILYIAYDTEYNASLLLVATYIGTLLAPRLVTSSLYLTRQIVGFIFNSLTAIAMLSLFIGMLWRYFPASFRRAAIALDAVTNWPFIGLSAVLYFAFVAKTSLCQYTVVAVASANAVIWSWAVSCLGRFVDLPRLEAFTYASSDFSFDPATEIRLLKIHRKFPFLQLSAELISCPLLSAPPYHAISYVWNHGPQDMRSMVLNGKLFRVRGNVHDILVRCSSFSGPQLIWIDTICIDQNSVPEKNLQVRAMQDIYAKAAHVLICLGGTSWNLLYSLVIELQTVGNMCGDDFLNAYVAGFRLRIGNELFLRARVNSLVDLMRHSWFSRAWVVQEAVVASCATFFYGGHSLPWTELHNWQKTLCKGGVFSTLVMLATNPPEVVAPGLSGCLGFLSLSFLVGYQLEYSIFGPRHLAHVLRLFGEKMATDPLDKVFALIGISEESDDMRLKSLIDYDRPYQEVLLDLSNYLLDTGQALAALDLGGLRQGDRSSGLPSWAVDWCTARVVASLNPIFSPSEIRYHASGNRPSRARRGSSRREMVVGGQHVDQIARLAPLPIGLSSSRPFELLTKNYPGQALSLARQHVQDPYPHLMSGQSLEEAVWRTLLGDKTHSARPAPASCGYSIRTLTELMRTLGEHVGMENLLSGTSQEILSGLGVTYEQQQEAKRAHRDLQDIDFLFDIGQGVSTFIFCVTEKGYIGMVPHISEVGDEICLVYGVDVPCVLRRVSAKDGRRETKKYQLVGDAYIHGIMDGEALPYGEDGDIILI
ncbi:heterokaryon incompatibility [Fusarium longipes]|uniref:Heterokaryon incompatibility n=1 Tax=Fusarium longipes TaxID=694270 RepID=A0A395SBZ8_9HYPO|nr:heterokaryon incompatibility [Fusarium longipes]